MVHIPSMIKQLGPVIRHSCFNFESAHNYFKELAGKQNFKNLPKSLAERCQLNECGNFADWNESAKTHPLFATKKVFGPVSAATETEKRSVQEKFNSLALLPGVKLQHLHEVAWVVCHSTKFKCDGIVCNVSEDDGVLMPVFGSIYQI